MNLTLSVEEQLVERAREAARQRGTSLNALIREYIEVLAGKQDGDEILAEFERLWSEPLTRQSQGQVGASRDSAYEERLDRYKPE